MGVSCTLFPYPLGVSVETLPIPRCDRRSDQRMRPWHRPEEPVSTHRDVPVRTAVADPPAGIPEESGGKRRRPQASRPGPFARLGAWAASHFRRVLIGWVLVVLVFGIFAVHVENALAGAGFAVHVENALAGDGWQASNSQSVAARAIIEKDFSGLGATALQVVIVDHHGPIASDPKAQAAVVKATNVLRSDPRVSTVVPPQAGVSLRATAGPQSSPPDRPRTPTRWCKRLTRCSRSWRHCPHRGVTVTLTGDSALWANFNTANRSAMLRSEMLSWPVTIVIYVIAFGASSPGLPLLLTMAGLLVAAGLVIAFGSLVAAGLPLLLTMADCWSPGALVIATEIHARLHLGAELRTDVRPRPGHRLRPLLGHALPCRPHTTGRGNLATARRSLRPWLRRSTPPARRWRSAR